MEAIQAVHRKPVSLRKSDITSSEGILRGARCNATLDPVVGEDRSIAAYSVLAPGVVEASARTFRRAPLQVIARIDVLCGGAGRPITAPERLSTLAAIISADAHEAILPQIVLGEISCHQLFGPRSGTVARVASRLAAISHGFDPRGLCVPETYLRRHAREYEEFEAAFATPNGVPAFVAFALRAWAAGAQEAMGIAQSA